MAELFLTSTIVVLALVIAAGTVYMRRRNMQIWFGSWLRRDWCRSRAASRAGHDPVHILFAIADHFEPMHGGADMATQTARVAEWLQKYPEAFEEFRDADGVPPRHTFFYPAEAYSAEHVRQLEALVREGYGEVEVHLHHENDTETNLRQVLQRFVNTLASGHGLLGRDEQGRPQFAFVHGNWALDNSLPDGRWCGVNNELLVLKECGCYGDFTLPSAPSPAQTRRINSIYYANDDPDSPKSHNDGVPAQVGEGPSGDLLIVQGPLAIRWPGRRLSGLLPTVETGNLTNGLLPTPRRVDAWIRTGICVKRRPEWVFVKLYTHGCSDHCRPTVLGEPMRRLHHYLARHYNDGIHYCLHYVTAREMVNIIHAAEAGLSGSPGQFRDFAIKPPPTAARIAADGIRCGGNL